MRACLKIRVVALWLLTAFVAVFWGCDSGSEVSAHDDEDEVYDARKSNIAGSLNFWHSMKVEDVRIVLLDSACGAKDTLAPNFDSVSFKKDSFNLRLPYVKVIARFSTDSTMSGKMEFVQYANSSAVRNINMNLLASVSSKAMEQYLCEDRLSYHDARDKAYHQTGCFFGYDAYDYDGVDFNKYEMDPYIYSRYFISDSVFYSDYKEMAKAIAKGEFGDSLYRTRAADDLVKYFKIDHWEGVRGLYDWQTIAIMPFAKKGFVLDAEPLRNFVESAYGFPFCKEILLGDTIVNKTRGSAYYDTVFICDHLPTSDINPKLHWRMIDETEHELGPCVATTTGLVERDSLYYRCADYRWELVTDHTVILNQAYGLCDATLEKRLKTYRDTVYMCTREDYNDPAAAMMGTVYERTRYIWTADADSINSVYPVDESCRRELSESCGEVDYKMICGKFYDCVNGRWK